MRAALNGCRACGLWANATQAVPGSGPGRARLMLVGEQPGDQEDRRGEVFVGPAGRILSSALEEAGIDRAETFVTNAVKHFKWKPAPRGKRRLHRRPTRTEAIACRPWLDIEARLVAPRVIVCLGAVAAGSLLGAEWRIETHRGEFATSGLGVPALATYHPSAVLRAADGDQRKARFDDLVADLRLADAATRRAPTT